MKENCGLNLVLVDRQSEVKTLDTPASGTTLINKTEGVVYCQAGSGTRTAVPSNGTLSISTNTNEPYLAGDNGMTIIIDIAGEP